MKKQSLFLACMLIATFFTTHAQINSVLPAEKLISKRVNADKKPFSKSLLTKFQEDFPHATDEAWATTEKGYLVSFKITDIQYTVFLDINGLMTSQIRFYTEKYLPLAIRKQLIENYGCYTIRSVKEITSNNATAYLVTIENNLIWKVVRVIGREMDILEEHIHD